MTETLLIDEAWTRADPHAIKAAGVVGVIGYVSPDKTKNMTPARVKALHAAGLVVGLVWESTSARATQGLAAGRQDRARGEGQAKALGYPPACPLFYACDDDYDPASTEPYYQGVHSGATYPTGPYGSFREVEDIVGKVKAPVAWQTGAWSGASVSRHAQIYQRTAKTGPKIKGVPSNGYDEDVVLAPITLWGPHGPVVLKPPGAPKPRPSHTTSRLFRPTALALRLATRHLSKRVTPLDHRDWPILDAADKQIQRVKGLG